MRTGLKRLVLIAFYKKPGRDDGIIYYIRHTTLLVIQRVLWVRQMKVIGIDY
jgi:hypothetical protein